MEKEDINVTFENPDENSCYLVFNFSDGQKQLNLYDDNMDQLQSLFNTVMKLLIEKDINFKFQKEDFGTPINQLALDMCSDYVEELNNEISSLIKSENLIQLRGNTFKGENQQM
ncbi:MAG: hypothetical protein PUE27_01545 [Sharpea porci]|uniref:hypothetical protein n=1 Tax=Sharpea porci TaxID=2652286 RepID=UPI002409013C|nr:hypothetical protein [Sharpea porci]MDD6710758.1 hypothetical protein [Sharpea porci]